MTPTFMQFVNIIGSLKLGGFRLHATPQFTIPPLCQKELAGAKNKDAENSAHLKRILCGDNFFMRRINLILNA